ncbi:MAG TPA: hypothetical protein VKU41_11640, partial [Polyangiaceae bacterium]|nr:hypothetical protein [Polyangiaceae bacterium]
MLAFVAGLGVLSVAQCSSSNGGTPMGADGSTASCGDATMAPHVETSTPDSSPQDAAPPADIGAPSDPVKAAAATLIDQGRHTFRYDTFGDEAFWGGALKLHEAIEGSGYDGGVGSGVSPQTAL